MSQDDIDDEKETIFITFCRTHHPREVDNFYAAFYTAEKAQKCCDRMNATYKYGTFMVREEEIE